MAPTQSKNYYKQLGELESKNRLRRMYLLNEPAFKKYQEELDQETHLSDLDKEVRKVLRSKAPPYKKWLQYRDAFERYTDYKKMLIESKANADDESVKKLSALEGKLKQLQTQLEENPKPYASKSVDTSTNDLPTENERKEETELSKTGESEDIFQNAMSDESPNISVDSLQGANILNNSGDIKELFDNDVVAGRTPDERIEHLPSKAKNKLLVDGKLPTNMMAVTKYDTNGEPYKEMINAMKARISKHGTLHARDAKGDIVTIENLDPFDTGKIRSFLLQKHEEIDKAIEDTGTRTEKPYKIKKANDDYSYLQSGRVNTVVPTFLIDEVIKLIESGKLPTEGIEDFIQFAFDRKKGELRNQLSDNSFFRSFATDDTEKTTMENQNFKPDRSDVSTPMRKPKTKKRKAADVSHLKQETITKYAKVVKHTPQQGKGQNQKLRWARI